MLPFWPLAAGGMRPTPPPLIPVSMGNFFRGLVPPMLNAVMPGQAPIQPKQEPRSQSPPNPRLPTDFTSKPNEETHQVSVAWLTQSTINITTFRTAGG